MEHNLDFNFQVLLDSIGLIQGVTLGVLLIILNKRKYRSTLFLGLFLLFFSLELATFISMDPKVSAEYPKFFLLPFNFAWLLLPLFFIYTQQVSVLSSNKIKYWILYPGIVAFLIQVVIFWLPVENKQIIFENEWYALILWVFGFFYSWIIGIWNLRLLYKHSAEVKNTYSYITLKELRWARFFLIYLLANSVTSYILTDVLPIFGYPENFYSKITFSVMDLIGIYWVSYFGIVQRNVRSVLSKNLLPDALQNKPIADTKLNSMMPEGLEGLMKKIDDHMTCNESFTNPDLTIADLANDLKLHPKPVSVAINTHSQQNFNSYVNQLRINKAKMLLKDQSLSHFSIEGIGEEVGFHSKSAFYSAFKKVTETTPAKYKERIAI
ncbi:MAG: helix-turn-helix transcriptional regulator [Maribacter sp.]|jgi:AraC-like DNA-binding protein